MKFAFIAVIVAALIASVFATPYCPMFNKVTFEEFLATHEKPYATANGCRFEFETRRQIFASNMETIRAHNLRYEQGLETWYMKPTQFADMTEDEFERNHLGFTKQTPAYPASKLSKLSKISQLKAPNFQEIDWSDKMMKSVDQGSCGSCWANAAANTLYGRAQVQFPDGQSPYPSRQQWNSCTPNPRKCGGSGGCQGATAQLAFNYTKAFGFIASEKDYPYTATDSKCTHNEHAAAYKISGFTDIVPNDRAALLEALKAGPVSVSAYASGWSFYAGGIFTKCDKYDINHAITLVGVGFDSNVNKYYYKIQNSWSSSWGENGYMRLFMAAPEDNEICGIDKAPFDGSACQDEVSPRVEACACNGLLYDSTYPTGIVRV